jgi:hypothetical protein
VKPVRKRGPARQDSGPKLRQFLSVHFHHPFFPIPFSYHHHITTK